VIGRSKATATSTALSRELRPLNANKNQKMKEIKSKTQKAKSQKLKGQWLMAKGWYLELDSNKRVGHNFRQ